MDNTPNINLKKPKPEDYYIIMTTLTFWIRKLKSWMPAKLAKI